MLIPLVATGMATLELLLAQLQPDPNSIGQAILGVGGGTLAWLLSRQIKQMDTSREDHERRLNRHGKSIAALATWTKLPALEKYE